MKDSYDVVVVGAGPAGSSAAITLAREGASVALLESGRFPRQKVCGEFVSPESLTLLESLLESHGRAHRVQISQARLFLGSECITTGVHPAAASITRAELDYDLWCAARLSGVDCLDESPVLRVEPGVPASILLDRGHRIRSRCVVDATGRWSRLRAAEQATLLRETRKRWIGLKAHFYEHEPSPSVDLYFFDGGYCGVQPTGTSEINVCAMVRSDCASSLDGVFRLHTALYSRSSAWKPAGDPLSTSPLIFRQRKPVADQIFRVGDAAGFVDPFAGDGISLALRSGHLAAEVITRYLQNLCTHDEALKSYEREYLRRFEPIFRSASRIRALLEGSRPLRSVAFSALRIPAIAEYMVRKTRGRVHGEN